MKSFCIVALVCAAVSLGGCTPRPVTETEFLGFCYTAIGRVSSCDTFTICDAFDTDVLSVRHASRRACNDACDTTYNALYGTYQFDGCEPTVHTASNWCHKFCNTNYAQ